MLITIVIPLYNGADYIGHAIASALGQSYKNIEIIILDDNSTDESLRIANAFAGDDRVKLHKNERNIGAVGTLNKLFSLASGSFVRILCQDDVLKPEDLQVTVRFLEQHSNVGFCFSDFESIDSHGREQPRSIQILRNLERVPSVSAGSELLELFFRYGCLPGNLTPVTIRRDAFEKVNGFDPQYKFAFDFDLWVRLAQSYPMGHISSTLCQVRSHPRQLSRVLGVIAHISETNTVLDQLAGKLDHLNAQELYILRKIHYQHQFHVMISLAMRRRFDEMRTIYQILSERRVFPDLVFSYPFYLKYHSLWSTY